MDVEEWEHEYQNIDKSEQKEWKKNHPKPKKNKVSLKRFMTFTPTTMDDNRTIRFENTLNEKLFFYLSSEKYDDYVRKKIFKKPYARTCHATQGCTFENKILIHGLDAYCSLSWIYTAISRATYFENVYLLFDETFDRTVKCIKPTKIAVQNRILSHQKVDRDINSQLMDTYIEKDRYIDVDWVFANWNYDCPFYMKHDNCEGSISVKNWSIDRLRNGKEMHLKDNCQIICSSCQSGTRHVR